MIFDVVIKARWNAKDQSPQFDAVYAPVIPGGEDQLVGLVRQAQANLERAREFDRGNRAECIRWGMTEVKVCPFYGTECQGG